LSKNSPSDSPFITYGNVQDAVVDAIRSRILSGQFQPGERLRQDELAKTFDVSTMPIREALRHLEADGLVTFHPRRGASVTNLSVAEYEEIYRIREELEVLACRWAAEDFDRIPMDQLKSLLEDIEAAEAEFDDIPRRLQLVREFSFTILQASEKEHLLRILTRLWDMSQQYRRFFSTIPEITPQRLQNYRNVIAACESRDADQLVAAYQAIYRFGRSTLIPLVRQHEEESSE
jgi:DNA-binding GntR family transcriptional regulator